MSAPNKFRSKSLVLVQGTLEKGKAMVTPEALHQ